MRTESPPTAAAIGDREVPLLKIREAIFRARVKRFVDAGKDDPGVALMQAVLLAIRQGFTETEIAELFPEVPGWDLHRLVDYSRLNTARVAAYAAQPPEWRELRELPMLQLRGGGLIRRGPARREARTTTNRRSSSGQRRPSRVSARGSGGDPPPPEGEHDPSPAAGRRKTDGCRKVGMFGTASGPQKAAP